MLKRVGVFLLLAIAVGIAYYNALGGEFVFDDYLLVVDHPTIRLIAADPSLILSPSVGGYRPLRTFSYALDYSLGGMDPWVFHLSNLLYHWITACVVFLVAFQLTNAHPRTAEASHLPEGAAEERWRPALFVALLWTLHPVQTDAVAYIAGRRDILGGLCLFVGLWAYLRFRTAAPDRVSRYGWLGVACVVYVLGVLSKESVLILPILCWLSDLIVLQEGIGESLRRRWALYGSVLLGGGAVIWYFSGSFILAGILKGSWYGGSLAGNFATVARIWVRYLEVMVFPHTLIADYSFNGFPVSRSFTEPDVLLSLSILAGVAVGSWLLSRWHRLIGYGAWWLFITILPVSQVIPIRELAAEHYLYVPVFGLCLIGGVILDAMCGPGWVSPDPRLRWRAALTYGLVVILLGGATVRIIVRNRDWQDEETLWTVTLRAVPDCARAHYNLGGAYLSQERFAEAKREFTMAVVIQPNHVKALTGLGEVAFKTGSYGQAHEYARQAATLNPRRFDVQYLLGWTALALGKLDTAEGHLQKARHLRPRFAGTYAGLEAVAKAKGDQEAEERWGQKYRALERGASRLDDSRSAT